MEFKIAPERVFLLKDVLSFEEAKKKAWDKKLEIFGTFDQLTSFLSKPKDEDFELTYSEHRFQPFWHIHSKANYVYDRKADYQIPVAGPEVQSVHVLETEYMVTNKHIHVPVMEHCLQTFEEESFIDGLNGQKKPDYKAYLNGISEQIDLDKIEASTKKEDIIVPPQARVSAIMREMLARMIHGIQADKIHEENIEVKCVDLYFKPIYSFKYRWISKNKETIVEIDSLNGNASSGSRTFQEYLGKFIDRDFLFDLGADAAGMFIPGGSIAVKVTKKVLDAGKK